MSKTGIFLSDGCEEIEALTVVDTLRRTGLDITMISINESTSVTGSHGIPFIADTTFEKVNFDEYDAIVLPGGMPGTIHLGEHEGVASIVKDFFAKGKLVCAICAAPSVLGAAGILQGRHATCHPGFEEKLTGAIILIQLLLTEI